MNGAVYRRAGFGEDANNVEGLVRMFDEADRAGAVGQHQLGAQLVTQLAGNIGAEYGIVKVAEALALAQCQRLVTAKAVVVEVGLIGPQHSKAAVRIAQRQRDGPFDLGLTADLLKAVPANVVGGVADAEHRIQQQLNRAGAGADDQVGAADCAGKAGAGLGTHALDRQQQGDAQGDGDHRQQGRKAAVGEALRGKTQQVHLSVSGLLARLSSASDRARSKRVARLVS